MTPLEEALAQLAERRPALIDLGLSRVFTALERLGDPHLLAPPAFHIAGTNGKGSTLAYIRSILETAGYAVHAYISPHLVRANERIVLAGAEISDDAFIDAIRRVDAAMGEDALTFFETITCAAFLAFAETPADYLVLETGLGGRLDATNVLPSPAACVITPIALDHQHYLGDTLAAIAGEKAGIFRKGAPAVIGPQTPEAMAALENAAHRIGAIPHVYGSDWRSYPDQGRLAYQDDNGLSDITPPRLAGIHQFQNAGLAVAAIRAAGVPVSDEALSDGVSGAFWPARLQRLKRGPLIDLLAREGAPQAELWLDGGHNPHAARALALTLAEMDEKAPKPLVLVSGMQGTKDAAGFFEPFAAIARCVFTVAADHQGAVQAEALASVAERSGLTALPCETVAEAVLCARRATGEEPRIVICGSLYLAGEVLKENA